MIYRCRYSVYSGRNSQATLGTHSQRVTADTLVPRLNKIFLINLQNAVLCPRWSRWLQAILFPFLAPLALGQYRG
eukprot:3936263-Rhodomonas_salina.1